MFWRGEETSINFRRNPQNRISRDQIYHLSLHSKCINPAGAIGAEWSLLIYVFSLFLFFFWHSMTHSIPHTLDCRNQIYNSQFTRKIFLKIKIVHTLSGTFSWRSLLASWWAAAPAVLKIKWHATAHEPLACVIWRGAEAHGARSINTRDVATLLQRRPKERSRENSVRGKYIY